MTLFDESDARYSLFAIAQARVEAARNQDAIIAAVKGCAREVCGSDGITFVLREGALCHYVEEDAIGPLWKGQRFPIETCISGWTMLHGETAVIEDVFNDPRIPYDAYLPTFVKSLIMVPVGTKNVAAIGAYWQDRRSFSDAEVMTVKTFGTIVGRALSGMLSR